MTLTHHLVAIGSFFIAIIALIYWIVFWIRQHTAVQWNSTLGEILQSHVVAQADGWSAHVRYSYSVSGKHYTNDRIYLHPNDDTDQRRASHLAAAYPVGQKFPVYFNPGQPKDSVLDRRPSYWRLVFYGMFAAFFFTVGIAIYRNPQLLS
jgi:hypothetical protein